MTDHEDQPASDPDYESMVECVERLAETSTELRDLGDDAGIPAVERNAKRVQAAVAILEMNLPAELVDEP